jgi:hypothetical protein
MKALQARGVKAPPAALSNGRSFTPARDDLEGLEDQPKWGRLLPQCFPDILPASRIIP